MTLTPENSNTQETTNQCYAFCPECGSDLYYRDNECICKNKNCSWTCDNCKK